MLSQQHVAFHFDARDFRLAGIGHRADEAVVDAVAVTVHANGTGNLHVLIVTVEHRNVGDRKAHV